MSEIRSLTPKCTITKNYNLFYSPKENRPVIANSPKMRRLRESMSKYGYLYAYPIVCRRVDGKLFVQDGQHRLHTAESLGLAVSYTVSDVEFDIAAVNNTQASWVMSDYVGRFAAAGNPDYIELQRFSAEHGIGIAVCASMLCNRALSCGGVGVGTSLVNRAIIEGRSKITNRDGAELVAGVYSTLTKLAPELRTRIFIGALMAAALVKECDFGWIIKTARNHREMLIKYGDRGGFLEMLEDLHNFGRREKKLPLKFRAEAALRDRNPAMKASGDEGESCKS